MVEPLSDLALHIQKEEKKKTGKEMSDQEAQEASDNLVGFFDLLIKIDRRNKKQKDTKYSP